MRLPTSAAAERGRRAPHPWWRQAWLQGRRSMDIARLASLAVLGAATLAAVVALSGNRAAAQAVFEQRHLLAIAVATILFFALRVAAAKQARSLRYGWMAALPLPARSGPRTLLLATGLIGALAMAWLAVGLIGLGVSLGGAAYLAALGPLFAAVAAACVGLASIALRAWHRPLAMPLRPGIRVPLISLAWLEDARLPYLVAWQNRECTRQWRIGGGAKPVGIVLLLFPGSPSPWQLFGLIALVLLVAWHRCLLQSSLHVVARAVPLTRQWSLPPGCARRALLRLPLAGSVLASALLFALLSTVQPPLQAAAGTVLALALASPITLLRLLARYRELES